MDDHGDRHRDEDDVVDTRGVVDTLAEHKCAEQDRHRPLQARPQDEYSLTEVKLDRNQQQSQAHWTDREDHQGGQHESGPEITAVEDVMQGDGQSERGEGDDLAKTAQRRCEPLDLAFVGGAGVADQDAGQKTARKPEPWHTAATP